MPKKIVLGLLLLVLLPLGLLGGFGWRLAENEQQLLAHQVNSLVLAQLRRVDEVIQSHFQRLEQDFRQLQPRLRLDTAALRSYLRTALAVRQILVMDADGKRLFPPPEADLSDSERLFLQRTAALWENRQVLTQSGRSRPDANADSAPAAYGWYAWYWNAELHHLFWQRDAANRLWGFELDAARLRADLIGMLPASGGEGDALGQARIRLVDANDATVYQWGHFDPPEGAKSQGMLPLSHPLGTWKLDYFSDRPVGASLASRIQVLGGLLALAFTLIGLAVFLYREQAREMRDAAQRVNFVNQVSHELKTPLTNIRLYAELLDDELTDAEEKPRRYLAVIMAESLRLSRLIANVLNFARDQKARLLVQLAPGSCDEVVARCIQAFTPALRAKGVEIRCDAQAAACVELDAEALEQILNNLFSNVEKYGAAGGVMEVSTRHTRSAAGEHMTIIKVRDIGPGIPERERERVFQPFYRVSSKLSDGVTGTGIGLAIARKLARLHQGELRLLPEGPGASFEVVLKTPLVETTP